MLFENVQKNTLLAKALGLAQFGVFFLLSFFSVSVFK